MPLRTNSNGGSILMALLIILLIVIVVCMLSMTFNRRGKKPHSLARELAIRGWVLYTRPGCPYCTKQMRVLDVEVYPKQVVCIGKISSTSGTMPDSQGPYSCKNVEGFPFWVNEFTNVSRTGLQNRAQLEQMLRVSPKPGPT